MKHGRKRKLAVFTSPNRHPVPYRYITSSNIISYRIISVIRHENNHQHDNKLPQKQWTDFHRIIGIGCGYSTIHITRSDYEYSPSSSHLISSNRSYVYRSLIPCRCLSALSIAALSSAACAFLPITSNTCLINAAVQPPNNSPNTYAKNQ